MIDRKSIDSKYKWKLGDIYEGWEKWDCDIKKLKEDLKKIPDFEDKIKDSKTDFVDLINLKEIVDRRLEKLYIYAFMWKDLNSLDQFVSKKLQEIEYIYSEYGVLSAWITPKILEIPKDTMDQWIESNKKLQENKFNLNEIYRLKKHVLDIDKEKLLSYFSQYMGATNSIYNELSTSDIKWNKIKLSSGEEVEVTNAVYSKILGENKNVMDRKHAFEALYKAYEVNKNTYASIYKSQLQRDVAFVKAKNYKTTLEQALEPDNIPIKVYENLIESAKENSEPLKKYIGLRKKCLGLEKYHYYDNQIKIADYKREFSYDEAKKIVLDSVKPLGEEYYKNLEKAISDGWLDVFETPNKRSGAYSINIYDVHPYMLLNYNGTMDSVFTLAHELGHTLHSMYSTKNQPYATNDYTIFVAEVASTFNEKLLLKHMLEKTTDKNERIALIEEAIGNIMGTYYLQALFANYEYETYKIIERGEAITPDVLDVLMEKLFEEYFGEELIMDDLQKIIWSRIPHFFNSPYYVYQYATSFSASSKLFELVTDEKYSEGEKSLARNEYLKLLSSGGNNYPVEQLKIAGVNLEEKINFKAVSEEMEKLIELLEKEI
ncbi:oligoendopeptidase F [Fusobacterium sp. MFO224]|uniref:oligoendopeptidase F n=1 Tax=Fusobacterium sp. MFO224 TaxID=3378070 RepID=UPI00385420A0